MTSRNDIIRGISTPYLSKGVVSLMPTIDADYAIVLREESRESLQRLFDETNASLQKSDDPLATVKTGEMQAIVIGFVIDSLLKNGRVELFEILKISPGGTTNITQAFFDVAMRNSGMEMKA